MIEIDEKETHYLKHKKVREKKTEWDVMKRRRITMKIIYHKKGEETDNKVKCV